MWKNILLVPYSLLGAGITWFIIEILIKRYIRKQTGKTIQVGEKHLSEVPWVVFFSGFFEIMLYSGSFLVYKPEFIILWVGVKTALRWDRKRNKNEDLSDIERRGIYHSFLMGTAINIILGFTIACTIKSDFLIFCK